LEELYTGFRWSWMFEAFRLYLNLNNALRYLNCALLKVGARENADG
jgi:hypothetical protein